MLTLIIAITIYLACSLFLTYQLYKSLLIYWKSKIVSLKKDDDYHDLNIHNLYPEFNRVDNLSFTRLFLGVTFLVPIRIILFLITICTCILLLKLSTLCGKNASNCITRAFCIFGLYIIGIFPTYKKVFPKEIYEKWLGENYDMKKTNFAFIISNHISSFEAWYLIYKYSSCFIAKKTIETLIFFGRIAKMRDCLFVDRTDNTKRNELANLIKVRGEGYLNNKEENFPLTIFAEGTTTNGEYLIKFKRGAFTSMLPVRPVIFSFPFNLVFQNSATMGVMPNILWLIYSFSSLYHRMEVKELPIIEPNEIMISNYYKYNRISLGESSFENDKQNNEVLVSELKSVNKNLIDSNKNSSNESTPLSLSYKSSDKKLSNDEIYAEVVRSIMSEVGGLKTSEKSFKEMLNYISTVRGYTIKNT